MLFASNELKLRSWLLQMHIVTFFEMSLKNLEPVETLKKIN